MLLNAATKSFFFFFFYIDGIFGQGGGPPPKKQLPRNSLRPTITISVTFKTSKLYVEITIMIDTILYVCSLITCKTL
jgi:hypothetical protein